MRGSQRNKLNAKKRHDRQAVFVLCNCGHCPSCKFRQSPEERMRQHLSEVNGHTYSDIESTLGPERHYTASLKRMHNPIARDQKSNRNGDA